MSRAFEQPVIVAVLAHNEERRIAACLGSLPLGDPRFAFHVVVNGSSDRTAAIARQAGGGRLTVHDWPDGGKARSWNRLVFDTGLGPAPAWIFVDGDAEVRAGSFAALVQALAADPLANAASGLPCNGRRVAAYRQEMIRTHGLFGDLYALDGGFVTRMCAAKIRLPGDLIGDDGLIAALAKIDLGSTGDWRDARVVPCPGAGFLCEPAQWRSPASWRRQYRRMINYSQRHFQNEIVKAILHDQGPAGLPGRLAGLYPRWLGRFAPRRDPKVWWFDRVALRRMARACQTSAPGHMPATP